MGRMQLFTETTVTAVPPVISNPNWHNFGRLARLWNIVLVANLVGTFMVAAGIASGATVTEGVRAAIIQLSGHLVRPAPIDILGRAIPASFLVASIA